MSTRLPFLYQTPTILRQQVRSYASDAFGEITTLELQRQAKNKIISDWSRVNRSPTRERRTSIKPPQSRSNRRNHKLPPLPPARSREWTDHIPFEGTSANRPATILDRLQGQTMTRHEFNVFKDILAKGATAEGVAEKVVRRKVDSTGRAKGVVRTEVEMPELLRPLKEEADMISAEKRAEREKKREVEVEVEVEAEVEVQTQEDKRSTRYRLEMEKMMEAARTDTELWEIFDTTLRKDVEAALSTDQTENSREEQVNLQTLTSTLPHLLQDLSHRLITTFPGSLYPLSLLPALRSLGPSAFTLGATTDLFNAHMRCLFHIHSDLHGIAETLAEMERDVFEFNEGTSKVLEDIFETASRAQRGQFGQAVRILWATERKGRGMDELERWEGVVAERRGRAEARRVEALRREGDAGVQRVEMDV